MAKLTDFMLKMTMAKGMRKAFKNAAMPWGDTLPTTQPPMVFRVMGQIVGSKGMEDVKAEALRQYATDLHERAKRAGPTLKKICQFLMFEANKDLMEIDHTDDGFSVGRSFELGKPKTIERILKKARDEKKGVIEEVTDPARCRIKARTPKQVAAMCGVMQWAHDNKIKLPCGAYIVDFKNRFDIPNSSRYRSGHAVVAVPLEEPDPLDKKKTIVTWIICEIAGTNDGFEQDIANPTVQKKLNAGAKADLKLKDLMSDSHSVYEWVRYIEERYQTDIKPEPVAVLYEYYRELVKKIHDDAAKKNGIYDGQVDFEPFMKIRARRQAQILAQQNRGLDYD